MKSKAERQKNDGSNKKNNIGCKEAQTLDEGPREDPSVFDPANKMLWRL